MLMPLRHRRQPEKVIQAHIVRLLRHVGCAVYVLGTRRRRGDYHGTMQSPGLPDLIAFLPRHLGVVFVEVKAPGGRLRPEQAEFKALAEGVMGACGGCYYLTGGLSEAAVFLMTLGLVKPEQIAHYHHTFTQTEVAS
jgi:hypothetical protein